MVDWLSAEGKVWVKGYFKSMWLGVWGNDVTSNESISSKEG